MILNSKCNIEFSEKMLNSWCNVTCEMPIFGQKRVFVMPKSVMLGISATVIIKTYKTVLVYFGDREIHQPHSVFKKFTHGNKPAC